MHFILGTRFQTQKKNNLGVIGLRIPNLVQNYIYPFFEKNCKYLSFSVSPGLSRIPKFSVPLIVYIFNPIVEFL